jgi:DNA repair exonuclease SbcCD ATPase subunit|tara:strand:+ start:1368 stop:3173 length:1806 start_codon:yes stop_codon:yes gene_type:complete
MKKVSFKRLSIVNFLSIGEDPVTIEFKKGLHVITGNNKDKPDRRNAIGKSTIADALYFSIFGETLRELKKDLIPNNLTNGKTHVELDFELDSPRGKNEYKIIRTLSPSKVLIFKDGVDRTRDSIKNTTKYISEVLSASPAIFQNCVIMTVNNATPFMAKNKIEKRKFIEDIFGMEIFSTMLYALRNEYNDLSRDHDTEATKLEEVEKSYTSYFDQKDKILQRRKDKKEIYLSRQKNNIEEKNHLNKKLKQIKEDDVTAIENKVLEFQGKLSSCDEKINEHISNISASKAEVTHIKQNYKKIGTEHDKCPVCLRGIEQHDAENIQKEKDTLKSNIENIVTGIKETQQSLEKAKQVKEKIQASIYTNTKKISDAKLQLQDKQNILARADQLNKWQEELKADIEAVRSIETDFDSIIVETKKRLTALQRKIKKYRDDIAKLDIVKYVVSEEGVKSYIVNKLLELLNSKLLLYLKKLDSNSICIFNEYFEEEILNEKNKVCSYFNFSGAERKSIDLACLFTFSDIRRVQGGVQYNIAIYDELFDSSFDEKGIELITRILHDRVEELDECSIVISHRKESIKAVTGDVIFLEKENGITQRVDYTEI